MPVLAAVNRLLGIVDIKLRLDIVSQALSRVRIFQQQARDSKESIANMDEPPRYAIRRRMIEGMVKMALQDYDSWFILAHSQGSVP